MIIRTNRGRAIDRIPAIRGHQRTATDPGREPGESFRERLHGDLLIPSDDGHEATRTAFNAMLKYSDPFPGTLTQVALEPQQDAVAGVAPKATTFAHCDARYSFGIWPGCAGPDEDERMIAWAREFHETMAPNADGAHANYFDRDEERRMLATDGEHYDRLAEVKAEWNPENRSRLNQNVEPAGGGDEDG